MTDENQTPENDAPSELDMLKARATALGVQFSPNIGLETLRNRVNDRINGAPLEPETDPAPDEAMQQAASRPMTALEQEIQLRQEMRDEHLRLIRVRIANMNPAKKEHHGEIFTVSNRFLGDVKKFIPYGEASDNGYHIPHCIYLQLKERQFLQLKKIKHPTFPGQFIYQKRMVPEFNIEVLPPLTQTELAQLANQQAAAAGQSVVDA